MKTLHTANANDNNLVERFDSIEQAVLGIVEMWHEEDKPTAYTVVDEEGMLAATVAPVGSDTAVVVYVHGQIDRYSQISYVRSADGQSIDYTRCVYNNNAGFTFIKASNVFHKPA